MDNLFEPILDQFRQILRQELGQFYQSNPPQATPREASKTIFNFTEFCKYVGLSKQGGYKITSRGDVPCSRRGKRLYFLKSEIDSWLLENRVGGTSAIKQRDNEYTIETRRRRVSK